MTAIIDFIREGKLKELRQWLAEASTLDIVDQMSRIESDKAAIGFRLLEKGRALTVFELLDPSRQQEILSSLREPSVRELLENMEPDDRARLLDEMPAGIAKRLLAGLSARERRLTSILLGYPENSVGRIMSPEFVNLNESMSAGDAIAKVRRSGKDVESIYFLPIVDSQLRFVGSVELGDLVLASPDKTVGSLMSEDSYAVRADAEAESAARLLEETGAIAIPVIDSENRLVGALTFDDAMEVLQEEETEDILRTGGSEPLGRPYLSASLLRLTRLRVIWLFVLAFAATLTVNVLNVFQQEIHSAVTLALFIPLLIGIGGNVGSQSATIIVRAMALDEVRFGDLLRVLAREVAIGVLLGMLLGASGFIPVFLIFGLDIAFVLLLSMLSISALAAVVGSMLPMVAKRIHIDPAVVSAPMISTLVDASGLVIYFLIAKTVLAL
jgi:magnesium transporter